MSTNRFWLYTGVTLLLFFSVAVMTAGVVLKKPLTGDDDVLGIVASIERDIDRNDWAAAAARGSSLKKAWQKVRTRLLFSSEKEDIKKLDEKIEALLADLKSRDRASAYRQINLIRDGWKDLE